MPVQGESRKYHKKHLFRMEIEGIPVSYWTTCSEIKAVVEVVEQHEGGNSEVADKSPGKVSYPNVTLTRGVTKNKDAFDWYGQVHNAADGTGEPDDSIKRNPVLVEVDRKGNTLRRITLNGAWPCEFGAGDWDGKASENVMESLTLCYQNFTIG